jgi:magnesium chelatase subunit I
MTDSIKTLGELKKSNYQPRSVKEEMRQNLIIKLKSKEKLFPNLIGMDNTVIPSLVNALLGHHDFILLGLRGQGKTRILRHLIDFLDKKIPVVMDCPINDDPLNPLCSSCRKKIETLGDDLPITWIEPESRYHEKLATPDVTMADLIGDIDPIKASNLSLSYDDEEVIHYGIIPKTNRGIFAINELPDLSPRIQVGLFNILEERDIQIRGFPLRLPLDILLAFSANPEDYTNRGRIITPLKDRINSQILTHYPQSLEDSMKITQQEIRKERQGPVTTTVPALICEFVEEIAFAAREHDLVDPASGVSARVTISAMENLISMMEQRALSMDVTKVWPRVSDFTALLPAVTGKIELVYEGEQDGELNVALRIIGQALQRTFIRRFSDPLANDQSDGDQKPEFDFSSEYDEIISWFNQKNVLEFENNMTQAEYAKTLQQVPGLAGIVDNYSPCEDENEKLMCMDFVLESLHQFSLISKESGSNHRQYKDMLESMFDQV